MRVSRIHICTLVYLANSFIALLPPPPPPPPLRGLQELVLLCRSERRGGETEGVRTLCLCAQQRGTPVLFCFVEYHAPRAGEFFCNFLLSCDQQGDGIDSMAVTTLGAKAIRDAVGEAGHDTTKLVRFLVQFFLGPQLIALARGLRPVQPSCKFGEYAALVHFTRNAAVLASLSPREGIEALPRCRPPSITRVTVGTFAGRCLRGLPRGFPWIDFVLRSVIAQVVIVV